MAAPMRSGSLAMSRPESRSANLAAATIRCAKRSMRRACLRSMNSVASKPFTSHAKWTAYRLESNWVISPAPDRPATRFSQLVSTSFPSGVRAPRPVITTLRRPLRLPLVTSHPEPAVDEKHFARDEGGFVGAEEAYRPGDVFRIAEPSERCVLHHQLAHFVGDHVGEARVDVPRRDDVRSHVAAPDLPRERLRES